VRVPRVRVSTLVRQLTERDAALLCQLAVCRYLRTEQVRALYFPDATLDRTSQRLRELATRRLVRNVRYAHDGVRRFAYWHLTPLGLTACQTLMQAEEIPYRSERDIRLRPHFLPHCVDVAEVRIQLELLVRAGRMRDYTFRTAGLARIQIDRGGRVERATPDALIAIQTKRPGVWWSFWLEIDEGTMTRRAMAGKAERIRRLLAAHDYKPDPAWSWLGSRHVTVILICEEQRRCLWLEEVFRAAGFTGHGHPQIWTRSSPREAAVAIATAVLEGDRRYAEQEQRRADEAVAKEKREVEERRKAEQLERAREEYVSLQEAWAEKQYQTQGLWKRLPVEHFKQQFARLYPFPSVGE